METPGPGSLLSEKCLLAGIVLLTVLVYLPTLRFEFVYDDQGQIVENALVHSWRFVPEYFQGQVWQYLFPHAPANYYRPLNILWFRLNHALFGLQPFGWHASAILLHLTATSLVFFLVRRITARPLAAGVAALLFGVHPTRHEVVAWVSGMTESLAAVFFLSALLAYLKSREEWTAGWMSSSCALYAAGLLAKETALVLPVVVFTHAFLYGVRQAQEVSLSRWQRLSQAAERTFVYLPIAIFYLVVRIEILDGFSHPQTVVSPATLLLTLPSVLFFYLKQWLLPFRLSEFYDLPLQVQWDVRNVLLPLALLVATTGVLWLFRRRLGRREVTLAVVLMGAPLLPVLNLSLFAPGELVHDRYYYLPGLGAALLVALALQPLSRGKLVFGVPQRFVLAMLALVLPLSYSTANASSYWVNDYVLFEHAHRVAPENATARNNYAVQLARRGDPGTALTMLQRLVDERPDYFLGSFNLGRLLYEMNLLGAAEHFLDQARKLDPNMPDTYSHLGMICMRTNRLAEAESHFRRALALQPRQAKYHFALGMALAVRGHCTLARSEFAEALSLNPELTEAQQQADNCGTAAAPVSSGKPGHGPAGTSSPPRAYPALEPVKRPLEYGTVTTDKP